MKLKVDNVYRDPFNTIETKIIEIYNLKTGFYVNEIDIFDLYLHGTSIDNINGILKKGFIYDESKVVKNMNRFKTWRTYDIEGVDFYRINPAFYFTKQIFKASKFSKPICNVRSILVCKILMAETAILNDDDDGSQLDIKKYDSAVRFGSFNDELKFIDERALRYNEYLCFRSENIDPIYVLKVVSNKLNK